MRQMFFFFAFFAISFALSGCATTGGPYHTGILLNPGSGPTSFFFKGDGGGTFVVHDDSLVVELQSDRTYYVEAKPVGLGWYYYQGPFRVDQEVGDTTVSLPARDVHGEEIRDSVTGRVVMVDQVFDFSVGVP